MAFFDLIIAAGSVVLVLTLVPFIFNKNSQSPRWISSVPIAAVLTFWVPFWWLNNDPISTFTILGQAVAWWLIAIFRPIKKV
jgi:hypothetical protein